MPNLLNQAVRNNVFWCEAVVRAHGISGHWLPSYWLSDGRVPTYYPNLITLSPESDIQAGITVLNDRLGADWGIKDSFGCLDLEPKGFQLVLSGEWYGRPGAVAEQAEVPGEVRSLHTAEELERWLAGWSGGEPDGVPVFPSSLLENSSIAFIHRVEGDRSVAGLVANLSDDVVGISNLFGEREALIACIDRAAMFGRGRAMVGYGDRGELSGIEPLGFSALGPVRVWVRSG